MDQNEKLNFLAQSIQNARKVMEKVETGNVVPSNSSRSSRIVTEEDVDRMLDPNGGDDMISEAQMAQRKNSTMKNMSKSRMPEAILKSFQENPIIDPTAPLGMESMMQEITKKVAPVRQQPNELNREIVVESNQPMAQNSTIDIKLIEYVIKKTVEETLEQVSKRTAIDENIQIKIGEKTFGGKINTLKEIKK
jgi:hypothetical protein